MRSYSNDEEKQRKKKIIMIILLIILLLMLITSCTSSFFGTIGDLFRNEGNYKINEGNVDKENVTNQELRFDSDYIEMYLSDYEKKVSFSYKNINPKEFTCTTSDAKIATCYASDGYVVINPKALGEVTVTLETETNGKKFRATTKIKIKEGNRTIEIPDESDTIHMLNHSEYILTYDLIGLAGDMIVTSSDESIVRAVITKDGVIKLISVGYGSAEITITVDYNGQKYTKVVKVIVSGDANPGTSGNPSGGNNGGSSGGSSGTQNPENPGGNENPPSKEEDCSLKNITISSGSLNFSSNQYHYYVGVDASVNKITLKVESNSSKSKITYTFNGTTVDNLNDLELKTGDNTVVITVTAENGNKCNYTVVINKEAGKNNSLSNLTVNKGVLSPAFHKNTLSYKVDVDANVEEISLNATLGDEKSKIKYIVDGKEVDSLNNIKLKTGENKVEIIVTSEDGTSRTYTVIINRKSSVVPPVEEKDHDSSLKVLTTTSGDLEFYANKYNYQIGVDASVNKISMTAKANSPKAKVTYTFNGASVGNLNDLNLKTGNNTVVITVTAEDGSTSTYKVVINKAASSENTLQSLTVNKGTLTPEFNKNKLSYKVVVGSDVDDITIDSTLSNNKSKVKYVYDGKEVENLKDLKLKTGKNEAQIIVTSEDGTSRTYTVTIIKNPSDNNNLSSLKGINYPLNETFDKNKKEYTMNVLYNTEKVSLSMTLEDENSTVSYKLNGKPINSLRDIELTQMDNELEIIVKSESGKENVYKVKIHKPERTIELRSDHYIVRLENTPYKIPYTIKEDGKEIALEEYDLENLKVSLPDYHGKYEVKNGYIILTPDVSMVGKKTNLTLTYNNQSVSTTLSFEKKNDYYLNTYRDSYDVIIDSKNNYRNIILNTNLFTGEVAKETIPNGVRVYLKNNKAVYVDITSSDPNTIVVDVDLDSLSTSSMVVKAIAKKDSGNANIYVQGYAFGEKVNDINIKTSITRKYFITLDAKANGGFFNEFTTKYEFKLASDESLDLSKYVPYKEAEGNCMYYALDRYNTKADGTGTDYVSNNVISNFSSDLTLYAIFKTTSEEIELKANKKLYLTDVDLFHNEEYFKLYNKDKIIYPGAQGSYVMTFENETDSDITITGITLEEDTICVEKGCLNMGYIIKYSSQQDDNYTYYYGSSTEYTILNKGNKLDGLNQTYKQIVFENPDKGTTSIKLEKGKGIEISLLWEWVDKEDELDTLIGNEAANLNDRYALTLSIDFETTNTHCTKN